MTLKEVIRSQSLQIECHILPYSIRRTEFVDGSVVVVIAGLGISLRARRWLSQRFCCASLAFLLPNGQRLEVLWHPLFYCNDFTSWRDKEGEPCGHGCRLRGLTNKRKIIIMKTFTFCSGFGNFGNDGEMGRAQRMLSVCCPLCFSLSLSFSLLLRVYLNLSFTLHTFHPPSSHFIGDLGFFSSRWNNLNTLSGVEWMGGLEGIELVTLVHHKCLYHHH